MIPLPSSARVRAHGRRLLRLPALQSAAPAAALLAAACVGVACGAGACTAAAVGAVGLAAAGLAMLRSRALQRELHAARRARAEWERRYFRLHDSVAVGVFRAGPDGQLSGANRGLCALLGYRSESELIAADFAQAAYVGPGTFEAVLKRARAQGALESLEMRLRRFDGLTVTVLATVQAIWDEAGEVTQFEGTVLDLTRERLAESQRRSMERRLRRLFDTSAVGMLVGNLRRGTLEEANPALIELFGLRPSELPVPLERVIPSQQRPLHRGVRAALETHGVAGPLAAEYVAAGGERVPVLLSAALVDPQHGEFVAVLVDRTLERDATARAARAQAALGALLEALPAPVAVFDGERRLIHANAALCEWLRTRGIAAGDGLAALCGAACPPEVAAAAARAAGGETLQLAADLERGGHCHRLDLTLLPRCVDGTLGSGFVAVLRDRPAEAARTAPPAPAGGRGGDCLDGRRTA